MQHRAYRMRLKPDRIADYVDVHRKERIWQSVLDGLEEAGIRRMLILRLGQEVILFEEAEDLGSAYRYLATHEESARWDRMITEWMELYPRFDEIKQDIVFEEIPVVFYFADGELHH